MVREVLVPSWCLFSPGVDECEVSLDKYVLVYLNETGLSVYLQVSGVRKIETGEV